MYYTLIYFNLINFYIKLILVILIDKALMYNYAVINSIFRANLMNKKLYCSSQLENHLF